ncbi:MAG: type I restriction enzyme HsdR N-terminal domain-containing protein [Roseofilum sp. Belize BBD 4]|uniref:type I restriction enzyme HsdR N-terminal domain-containing protein n=1 Tax=Roseofilum sp. Belize BBD 4 TaxID=2821500 RepID=UPI001B043D31|nr:type I restriction enzyme HsdR N-terminal domain-containing protein [Roseofilum sp. Belize BBD 4]MBP0035249.1 type I restriction enzyme HsdR N-terminal domain-containing protein [Roseofilum sp. Belize BBD 4]
MAQTLSAQNITLGNLKQTLGLQVAKNSEFFTEWSEPLPSLTEIEQQTLDRVKANFQDLMDDPPLLENTVKMVILAPLLDCAGFYRRPFRIETETSIEIELEDEGRIVRGRIDILVVKNRLWLVVIESKRSDFAVTRAIPQTLSYLLGNPELQHPTFGMITNGNEFLFLKASHTPTVQYRTSRLFSLINPDNELYEVLAILKRLSQVF